MTCFGKGLIDELARVDHCHFKDGWASHDLHKRAGIEIGTLTREVDRLRQLLSQAEKRETEARAKALEDLKATAERIGKRDAYSDDVIKYAFQRGVVAASKRFSMAASALQSEER